MKREIDGKIFAVKSFSKQHLLSLKHGKESLKTEITILRSLDHPNIVSLEEVSETKNSLYLVTEFLQGGKIFDLAKYQPLKYTKRVQITKVILETLSYTKSLGIIHRDIKPENILFETSSQKWTLKLIDFGLATFLNTKNPIFRKCGTIGFIAPEVFQEKERCLLSYSFGCDIYSVGILLYCMITGQHPFHAQDLKTVMDKNKKAIINWKNSRLQSHAQELELLKKMLEVNPKKRISIEKALGSNYFVHSDRRNQSLNIV